MGCLIGYACLRCQRVTRKVEMSLGRREKLTPRVVMTGLLMFNLWLLSACGDGPEKSKNSNDVQPVQNPPAEVAPTLVTPKAVVAPVASPESATQEELRPTAERVRVAVTPTP